MGEHGGALLVTHGGEVYDMSVFARTHTQARQENRKPIKSKHVRPSVSISEGKPYPSQLNNYCMQFGNILTGAESP